MVTRELIQYWGRPDEYLAAQAERTLKLLQQALREQPPSLPEPTARRLSLQLLDHVLHHEEAPRWPAVQAFHHRRIAAAADDIQTANVDSGAAVWKLYDHGFVVRTPAVTIGFDLARGYSSGVPAFAAPDAVLDTIVDSCDVLFISHDHDDHADPYVVTRFLHQDKPVVAPPQVLAAEPFHGRITHLPRQAHVVHRLPVQAGQAVLQVVANPGHQGTDLENNNHVVRTPDGFTAAHTGDQSLDEDFGWIDQVHHHVDVDLLMPNAWAPGGERLVAGFAPRLVIPGHENELGHGIDHREAYWLTYERLEACADRLLVMTWGERYDVEA
jgi:L-ascorbate metabolism protein UlaG (beta-lactamase superfamily)